MKNDKETRYTYDEFISGLKDGSIRLDVNTITGMNGAKYNRMPNLYESSQNDVWEYTHFKLYNEEFSVPSLVTKNDGTWFQSGPLLRGMHLVEKDSDIPAVCRTISSYTRRYSPFNIGVKKTFIHESGLPLLGYGLNREIIHSEKLELFKKIMEDDVEIPCFNYNSQFGIPYYPVDFITGYNYIFGNQYADFKYHIACPDLEDADIWCDMKGDVLTPLICEGDMIALKEVTLADVIFGEVYAIVLPNDSRTIRVLRRSNDPFKMKLSSINPYYKDIHVDQRSIIKIYAVKGIMRNFSFNSI